MLEQCTSEIFTKQFANVKLARSLFDAFQKLGEINLLPCKMKIVIILGRKALE